MQFMKYYFSKIISLDFYQTVQLVTESLKKEGFGVLTEINIQEKLKAKLNVDFRKYKILGACNPSYAYKALLMEDKIGTLLPCNVIVQELENDKTEVAIEVLNQLDEHQVRGNFNLVPFFFVP